MTDRRWRGCPLANPLCPDDLCDLAPGHSGYHRLSTFVKPGPVSEVMFMVNDWQGGGISKMKVMLAGHERALELWPELFIDQD